MPLTHSKIIARGLIQQLVQVTCLYLAKPGMMMIYSTNALRRSLFYLLVLLISLALWGCNGVTSPQTAMPAPSETPTPEPADTAAPTPSPSQSPPKEIGKTAGREREE